MILDRAQIPYEIISKLYPLKPIIIHHIVYRLPILTRVCSSNPFLREVSLCKISGFQGDISGAKHRLSKIIKAVVMVPCSIDVKGIYERLAHQPDAMLLMKICHSKHAVLWT